MTECNAIIEANKEIDRLKKENEKLNALCVKYGFEMGRLEEENKELKDLLKSMADRNNEIWLDNGQIIRLKKVFKGEWVE